MIRPRVVGKQKIEIPRLLGLSVCVSPPLMISLFDELSLFTGTSKLGSYEEDYFETQKGLRFIVRDYKNMVLDGTERVQQ